MNVRLEKSVNVLKTRMRLESDTCVLNSSIIIINLRCCIRTTHKIAKTPPHQDKDLDPFVHWYNS